MRGLVVLLLVGGTAYADPEIVAPGDIAPASEPAMYTHQHPATTSGMWLDFGAGITRIDLGAVYQANVLSFSPQGTFHRNFYFGPELYAGNFDTNTVSDQTALGGSSETPMHVSGDVLGINVVVGARTMAGMFSGAIEAVAGYRRTDIRDDSVYITSRWGRSIEDNNGVIEARARVDAWVTPYVSVGAIVGKSLDDASGMTAQLRLGVHFERYDHTR